MTSPRRSRARRVPSAIIANVTLPTALMSPHDVEVLFTLRALLAQHHEAALLALLRAPEDLHLVIATLAGQADAGRAVLLDLLNRRFYFHRHLLGGASSSTFPSSSYRGCA